jgi:hypothetical protein
MRSACAAAAFAAICLPAQACGVCIDDKVAATYDHAIVMRAMERRHVVVFAEAAGNATGADLARAMKAAAARVRGIDRESVRSAPAPLTLSFALDAKVRTPEDALAAVERGMPGVKLAMLRVMR